MCHVTCDMWHNYKYSLLSLHMKTKVVQHVPSLQGSTSIGILNFPFVLRSNIFYIRSSQSCDRRVHRLSITILACNEWVITFEYRHENKNCSACPKDQHKHLTYDSMTPWHDSLTNKHKQWLLSRHENKSCSACPKLKDCLVERELLELRALKA